MTCVVTLACCHTLLCAITRIHLKGIHASTTTLCCALALGTCIHLCIHLEYMHFVYTFVYTFGTLYRSGTMLCTLTCRMYTLCVHTLVDLLHSCTWHLHNVWQTCSTTCIHSLDLLHFVYTLFMCTCMLPHSLGDMLHTMHL